MKRVTISSTIGVLLTICFLIIILSGQHCDFCFSAQGMMIKFFVSGLVIFVGSIYFTMLYLKTEKEIFNIESLPLLETNEAVDGVPFSCEGKVTQGENILYSPYTNTACVYYHSITEKYVQSGRRSRWIIVENICGYTPFFITDSRGKLKVDPTNLDNDFSGFKIDFRNRRIPDPENSEIDCIPILKHQAFGENNTFLGFIPVVSNLRRSEYVLIPYMQVFAYGYISKRNDELVLHEYPKFPLIISMKTKEAYIEEFYKGRNLVFLVHVLLTVGFTISLLSINYFLNLYPIILYSILLAGNLVINISIIFTMYNRIMTLKQRAQVALSDIDIELKRRVDLIPQIVALVKNYSKYEKETLGIIAEMRVRLDFQKELIFGEKADFSPLYAIIENYPDLKASGNFQLLMRSLIDTEERIAYSRAFYNRNVRKLNTLIKQFPFIIISLLLNIREMNFISITSDEKSIPQVKMETG
jgi:LemA protein